MVYRARVQIVCVVFSLQVNVSAVNIALRVTWQLCGTVECFHTCLQMFANVL